MAFNPYWSNQKISIGILIPLVLFFALLPLYGSSYVLTIAITALHFAYLAQSWNLVFGYCGQLALGHGLFYGIGGYFSSKLLTDAHLTPYIGGVVGALAAALFAVPIGVIVFRAKLKGLYLALVTLAAMEIFKAIFNNWQYVGSSVGVYLPLKNAPWDFLFMSRVPYYFIALFMVVAMIFVTIFLQRSKLGYRAIAVRENEDAAQASGINCFDIKLKMFVLSAFLTGLAGTFYAQFMLYIVPEIMFGFGNVVLLPMLGVIVGGRGTIFGPIIGSLVFSVLGEILRRVPFLQGPEVSAATMMLYGIVLAVVSLRYYGGFVGFFVSWKRYRLLNRK